MKNYTIGKNGRLYERKYPLPEIGERHGSWTIQSVSCKTHRYKKIFVCRCDCGKIKEVKEESLCNGRSTSCGCVVSPRHKPGEKFGRLTLVEHIRKADIRNKNLKTSCWLAKCECNNEIILTIDRLVSGNTKSCGCLKKELNEQRSPTWQGYKEIPKGLFSRIKTNAESRGIEFDISVEYIWKLFLKQKRKCALSGCVLNLSSKNKLKDTTASLDRIDSKKGYVKGNVQWVHKTIQTMKFIYSQNYFLHLCKSVADYSEQK